MTRIAPPPALSSLFPELETIYNETLSLGGIAPGEVANVTRFTTALAAAIDKTMAIGIPESAIGDVLKHLVNVTIPQLQKHLDIANANVRTVSNYNARLLAQVVQPDEGWALVYAGQISGWTNDPAQADEWRAAEESDPISNGPVYPMARQLYEELSP